MKENGVIMKINVKWRNNESNQMASAKTKAANLSKL
jgi:hypothetical protein